ncbi:MAG: undecaprenyl-diphosphate phosphatase [Oscillospiraceae bacterium]|nr:undecaprenyl-diphosphate phosphatase [Oscillospiraceae bacterium]
MVEILKAVLMGIVEGITEWLPISSTGHMILLEQIVQFQLSEAFMSMFRVVIQLGAILAVVLLYFDKLWPFRKPHEPAPQSANLSQKLIPWLRPGIWRLWGLILIASVPAAVIGLPLDDWLDTHLYNAPVVAATLILYGVLFLVVDNGRRPSVTHMDQLTWKHALVVGLWQVLSLIPGTSRSGATIVGGLLLGLSRPVAAQFTFYLAIPVMAGASGLKLVKYLLAGNTFTGLEIGVMLIGMVVAFVVSLLAIGFLMRYVKKHSFRLFGWYRIALGVLVLGVFFVQGLLA